MTVDRPLSRFSVPLATLLLTLGLVFLAVHSSNAHRLANQGGAATVAHPPQPAPLPLTGKTQSQPRPTAAVPLSVPVPHSAADIDSDRVLSAVRNAPAPLPSSSFVVPGILLVMLAVSLLIWFRRGSWRMPRGVRHGVLALFLAAQVTGCGTSASQQPAQSPRAYVDGAMNWIKSNSVFRARVHWTALRHTVATMTDHARTTAATYPGIIYALEQTGDGYGFLLSPSQLTHAVDFGMRATYADRMVVDVRPSGPAARAGVRVGDVIRSLNGSPPTRFEGLQDVRIPNVPRLTLLLKRSGTPALIKASFAGTRQSSGSQCGDV